MMEGEETFVVSSPDEKGICSDTIRIKVLNVTRDITVLMQHI